MAVLFKREKPGESSGDAGLAQKRSGLHSVTPILRYIIGQRFLPACGAKKSGADHRPFTEVPGG
ncbi:MAG: hypothetical protein ACJ8G3_18520 [Burkholderiaceae bacterium]